LEIRAETLRARICSTTDLSEDASFNVENWLQRNAARAIRQKLATAFITGDGLGKPVGF
jgi:HK97 family phage major capsid protein